MVTRNSLSQPPARLAVLLNAACPETMARMMSLTNWLLPSAAAEGGDEVRSGWQSVSRLIPSGVTRLSDLASAENNELPTGTDESAGTPLGISMITSLCAGVSSISELARRLGNEEDRGFCRSPWLRH